MKTFALPALLLLWSLAITGAAEPIEATDLEALRAAAGTNVEVKGPVFSVGTTQDHGITFLNIGAGKKQGFVAVVFRDNYGSFPEGFEQYRGRTVVVSG
ncbi:MAG: hypothetical protein N2322_05090, partial [Terrimicrobiaceae bacterium]|nr:hypothetical protein [Terrimicrobiaceae bacterium]